MGEKRPKRGRPEETLRIDEDPETALQKLFQPKDERTPEDLRAEAAAVREQADKARQDGDPETADRMDRQAAKLEALAADRA